MSFAKKPERPIRRPVLRGAPIPHGLLLRMMLLGILAIGGAIWALVRHYTHELPPLRVPVVPREAPTFDADAGEIPVPEWMEGDGEAR
jgi:hypothetical protein